MAKEKIGLIFVAALFLLGAVVIGVTLFSGSGIDSIGNDEGYVETTSHEGSGDRNTPAERTPGSGENGPRGSAEDNDGDLTGGAVDPGVGAAPTEVKEGEKGSGIIGKVLATDGKTPASGAQIFAVIARDRTASELPSTASDENGNFSIAVEDGVSVFFAFVSGDDTAVPAKPVIAPARITVRLSSTGAISGRVVSADGAKPITSYSLRADYSPDVTDRMGASGAERALDILVKRIAGGAGMEQAIVEDVNSPEGRFELTGLGPGEYTIAVAAEGYAYKGGAIVVRIKPGEKRRDLLIKLVEGRNLRGKVLLFGAESSISGAEVSVLFGSAAGGTDIVPGKTAVTGIDGIFYIQDVVREGAALKVMHPTYMDVIVTIGRDMGFRGRDPRWRSNSRGLGGDIIIYLSEPGKLEGTIYPVADSSGSQTGEFIVEVSAREVEFDAKRETDSSGAYKFDELPAGEFRFTVAPKETPDTETTYRVKVWPGQTTVFDVGGPGSTGLSGRITAVGEPVSGLYLVLGSRGRGGLSSYMTYTDEDGRYNFRSVDAGTYLLSTRFSDDASFSVNEMITLADGTESVKDIDFSGARIKLTFALKDTGEKVAAGSNDSFQLRADSGRMRGPRGFTGRQGVVDSDGSVVFEYILPGKYGIRGNLVGYVFTEQKVEVADEDTVETTAVVAAFPARVSGMVVAADTGEPIDSAPVSVSITQTGRGGFRQGTAAGPDGTFSIAVPAGEYRLDVNVYGYASFTKEPVKVDDGASVSVNVELAAVGEELVAISGTALDAATKGPITAEEVRVYFDGIGSSFFDVAYSDPSGRYDLKLYPGRYRVHAECTGYRSTRREELDIDEETIYKVELEPLPPRIATLTGQISDASTGKGIAGAEVTISGEGVDFWETTSSDFNGYYSRELPKGTYHIGCRAPGFKHGGSKENLVVDSAGAFKLDIVCEPEAVANARIEGYVTDAGTGLPVHAARVNYSIYDEGSNFWGVAETDADGKYSSPVPPGRVSIRCTKAGYRYFMSREALTVGANGVLNFNFTIEKEKETTATISGIVADASTGKPVTGARLNAWLTDGSSMANGETDAEGRYELKVPGGETRINIWKAGYKSAQQTLNIADGAYVTLPFQLAPEAPTDAVITVRITEKSTGKPVPGASVRADGQGGSFFPKEETERPPGVYVANVKAGEYRISVWRTGYVALQPDKRWTVGSGQNIAVNLALEREVPKTVTLSIKVTEASTGGAVPGWVNVIAVIDGKTTVNINVPSGGIGSQQIPAGHVVLRAQRQGYYNAEDAFAAVSGQAYEIELLLEKLPPPDSVLEVRTVNPNKTPAGRVNLQIIYDGTLFRRTRTNPQGVVTLQVPAGEITVRIDDRRFQSAKTTVKAVLGTTVKAELVVVPR